MPIEFRKEDGRLVWVRSPFTGVITYFTEIHRKQSGFPRRTQVMPTAQPPDWEAAEAARMAELEAARRDCPFCPGNESQTTAEILRVRTRRDRRGGPDRVALVDPRLPQPLPRIPEICTGGRNESYVVVEDPRHFADERPPSRRAALHGAAAGGAVPRRPALRRRRRADGVRESRRPRRC